MHKCDNPPCINPKHLRAGTQQENVKDRDNKKRGRWNVGEKHHKSKLTEKQVLKIRELHKNKKGGHRVLAKKFGVGRKAIFNIVKRIHWKHI